MYKPSQGIPKQSNEFCMIRSYTPASRWGKREAVLLPLHCGLQPVFPLCPRQIQGALRPTVSGPLFDSIMDCFRREDICEPFGSPGKMQVSLTVLSSGIIQDVRALSCWRCQRQEALMNRLNVSSGCLILEVSGDHYYVAFVGLAQDRPLSNASFSCSS